MKALPTNKDTFCCNEGMNQHVCHQHVMGGGVMRNPLTRFDGDADEKFSLDFTLVENEFRSNLQKAGGVDGEEGDKEGGKLGMWWSSA